MTSGITVNPAGITMAITVLTFFTNGVYLLWFHPID